MSPPQNNGVPWKLWRQAWSQWARNVGLDVAWANQSGNPPERRKPYVRLQIINFQIVGNDDRVSEFDDVAQENHEVIQGLREITLNVQVIANAQPELEQSAWAWADELVGSLAMDDVASAFRQSGLSVSTIGQVIDLGGLEQSEFVNRATFEVVFLGAYYRRDPNASGWIDRIIGEGDLEGNSDPEITFDVEGP